MLWYKAPLMCNFLVPLLTLSEGLMPTKGQGHIVYELKFLSSALPSGNISAIWTANCKFFLNSLEIYYAKSYHSVSTQIK